MKEDNKKRINEIKKNTKFPQNIDCCSSYSYLNNNSLLAYKTPTIERSLATPISNPKNNETKIISSKIKYRQNKFVHKFDVGSTKLTKSSKKNPNMLYYMSNHSNVRIDLFGTNNKNSEFLKKNNNKMESNNQKLYDKKVNSSVIIRTINKIKIKNILENGAIIRRNCNNKLNSICKTKICINRNKKIIFPNSFINNSTSKVIPIKRQII